MKIFNGFKETMTEVAYGFVQEAEKINQQRK